MADLMAYLYFLHFIDEPGNSVSGRKVFSELGCSSAMVRRKTGRINEHQSLEISEGRQSHGDRSRHLESQRGDREGVEGKGNSLARFKKGELADLLEYIRTPERTLENLPL